MITKVDNEYFKNSTKWWICHNDYTDNEAIVKDQCHIIRKYREFAHRDFHINLRLNYKIPTNFTT